MPAGRVDASMPTLVPVTGSAEVPRASGVLLCPTATHHVDELAPLARSLRALGTDSSFVLPARDWGPVAAAILGAGVQSPLYAWPSDLSSMPRFDAVVVMNDWGPSRPLVELCSTRNRPSFAKVEGVQDFDDDDTGRWRYAYQRADHVLCQGQNDVEALALASTHVVGSSRLERIFKGPERMFGESRVVVANSNFTYRVLDHARAGWLASVSAAARTTGCDLLVSQHHADPALDEGLPLSSEPMSELLESQADVLVSRFSTVPFEAMARGVPFVYHNPHGERVPTFGEPEGAFWVSRSEQELADAIVPALASRGSSRKRSEEFFRRQVDIDDDQSSEDRAAAVIVDVLRRAAVLPVTTGRGR